MDTRVSMEPGPGPRVSDIAESAAPQHKGSATPDRQSAQPFSFLFDQAERLPTKVASAAPLVVLEKLLIDTLPVLLL